MAFNTHQHKYSWNVFFIFKRFSPSSHPPQPPASRRKRLKAAPEKAAFQPSVLSAFSPFSRKITGASADLWMSRRIREQGHRSADYAIRYSATFLPGKSSGYES